MTSRVTSSGNTSGKWCCGLLLSHVVLGVLLPLHGCQHTVPVVIPRAFTGYVSPHLAQLSVHRVLLLPIENHTSFRFADIPFHGLLASELRSTQLFNVVTCPESSLSDLPLPQHVTGTFPLALLAELRTRFNVDAVIFSSITEFHPYWPPKIGFELQMVDTAFGETVGAISGVWDSSKQEVSCQAKNFFQRRSPSRTFGNLEMVLHSPSYYSEFVTHDVAQGLAELWRDSWSR